MHALIQTPTTGLIAIAATLVAVALMDGGSGPVALGAVSATAGLAAIAALLVVRPHPRHLPVAGQIAVAALLGLALLTGVSMQWGTDDGAGFRDLVLALACAAAFIAVLLIAKPGSGTGWLRAVGAAGLLICAVSLGARLLDLGSWESSISAALPAAEGRLSGPLGYWNALGSLAAVTIPILLWEAASASSAARRSAALAGIALPITVILLTASRGAVVAALFGVVVWIAGSLDRRRGIAIATVAGSLGALACLLVAVVDDGGDVTASVDPVDPSLAIPGAAGANADVGLIRGSDSGRVQFWEAGLDAFASDPLRGVGAGGFSDYWNRHGELGVPIENVHSAPLESLAELGLLGGLISAAFLAAILLGGFDRVRAARRDPDATRGFDPAAAAFAGLVAGLIGFLFDWTGEIPGAFLPVLILAALVSGLGFRTPAELSAQQDLPGRGAIAAGACLLGGVAAIAAGTVLAVSAHSLDEGRSALVEGRLADAARSTRAAVELQPWSAEPHLLLAEIEVAADNLDAALRQARAAVRLAPGDFRTWRTASLVSGALGLEDAAGAYGDTAERLAPLILARAGQVP